MQQEWARTCPASFALFLIAFKYAAGGALRTTRIKFQRFGLPKSNQLIPAGFLSMLTLSLTSVRIGESPKRENPGFVKL